MGTDDEAPDPKVEYSNNSDLSDSKEGEVDVISISDTFIYISKLRNLKPNITYYYQVSSHKDYERKIMSFKTFPNQINKLKFVLFTRQSIIHVELKSKLL